MATTISPRPDSGDAMAFTAGIDDAPMLAGRARTEAAPWRWALIGVGAALLAALVYQSGPGELVAHLRALGWAAPLLLVPYGVASVFDTAGWRLTFASARPSLWLLYLARLVGEGLNTVTPTAYLGGEPAKAFVLRRFGIPITEGAASVILAKAALTMGQIAFVTLGVALFLTGRDAGLAGLSALAAIALAGAGTSIVLVRWQRRGLVASIARWVRRIVPRAHIGVRLAARAAAIDARLQEFYRTRPEAAVSCVALHLLGWIVGAGEVLLIMHLIGHAVSIRDAVIIEALAQPVRLLGIVVPGTLGVQEAGGMVIFGMLGLSPELGLAMMLVKRLREVATSMVGLGLLARLHPRG